MAAGSEGFICGECAALAAEAVAMSNPELRDQLIATLTRLRRRALAGSLIRWATKIF